CDACRDRRKGSIGRGETRRGRRAASTARRHPRRGLLLLLRGLLELLAIELTVLITVGRREVQTLDLAGFLLADHAIAVLIHFLEGRSFLLRDRGSRETRDQERRSDSCFHLSVSINGVLNVRDALRLPSRNAFARRMPRARQRH